MNLVVPAGFLGGTRLVLLSVVGAGVVVAFWIWSRHGFMVSLRSLLGAYAVLICLLPGVLRASGPYSELKVTGIALGVLVALIASQTLRTSEMRVGFLVTLTGAGLFMAAGLALWGTADGQFSTRLTIPGMSPLAVGFMCALAAVLLVQAGLTLFRRYPARAAACMFAAVACAWQSAQTGSRGPLFAALLAAAVSLLIARHASQRRLFRAAALATIGFSIYQLLLGGMSTIGASDRLTSTDSSGRAKLWSDSLAAAWEKPFFGYGWGDTAEAVPLPAQFIEAAGDRQYAHNLFIEVSLEGGLFALAGMTFLLLYTLRRLRSESDTLVGQMMLSVFVFALGSAMVSGDLAGNRVFWVMIGAALAVARLREPSEAPQPPAKLSAARPSGRKAGAVAP